MRDPHAVGLIQQGVAAMSRILILAVFGVLGLFAWEVYRRRENLLEGGRKMADKVAGERPDLLWKAYGRRAFDGEVLEAHELMVEAFHGVGAPVGWFHASFTVHQAYEQIRNVFNIDIKTFLDLSYTTIRAAESEGFDPADIVRWKLNVDEDRDLWVICYEFPSVPEYYAYIELDRKIFKAA